MNEIIRRHFPASRLPDELRGDLQPDDQVTVVVLKEDRQSAEQRLMALDEILARRRPPYRSVEDIDAEIRGERDAWDERS
jgi:hypothetical protein